MGGQSDESVLGEFVLAIEVGEEQKLDRDILAAHNLNDGYALVDLYETAGRMKSDKGDDEAASFLFTQAYIFGLEAAHPRCSILKDILRERGRET